jgi:plasmid stabilization system protein ParE
MHHHPLIIRYTPQAQADMDSLFYYIAYELLVPDTATKYCNNVRATISRLALVGSSLAQSQNTFLTSTYGAGVRTIGYKKMTVVYRVVGSMVVVIRVMAGSLI